MTKDTTGLEALYPHHHALPSREDGLHPQTVNHRCTLPSPFSSLSQVFCHSNEETKDQTPCAERMKGDRLCKTPDTVLHAQTFQNKLYTRRFQVVLPGMVRGPIRIQQLPWKHRILCTVGQRMPWGLGSPPCLPSGSFCPFRGWN